MLSISASLVASLFFSLLSHTSHAYPVPPPSRRSANGPMISSNFQDPSIILDNGIWYAFSGPNGNPADINVQVATSYDFSSWTLLAGYDALPNAGAWAADPPHLWSPDVVQMPNGQFVLYYSAVVASSPRQHCVGAATAWSIAGPYTPLDAPLACDLSTGGSIDPDGFHDPVSNTYWVAYKVDGNSLGHGGACSNTNAPIVPTPILLQQVDEHGVTPIGPAYSLITNDADDGADVEAPTIMYSQESGEYTLFYSSGCFVTTGYKVRYATSTSVTGPYTKQPNPLLVTGDTPADVYIPGGVDVAVDGTRAVFQADLNMGWFNGVGLRVRGMYGIAVGGAGPDVSAGSLY